VGHSAASVGREALAFFPARFMCVLPPQMSSPPERLFGSCVVLAFVVNSLRLVDFLISRLGRWMTRISRDWARIATYWRPSWLPAAEILPERPITPERSES